MASYRKEHHDEKENKARNLKDDSFDDSFIHSMMIHIIHSTGFQRSNEVRDIISRARIKSNNSRIKNNTQT